jgi:hypothetical protein
VPPVDKLPRPGRVEQVGEWKDRSAMSRIRIHPPIICCLRYKNDKGVKREKTKFTLRLPRLIT